MLPCCFPHWAFNDRYYVHVFDLLPSPIATVSGSDIWEFRLFPILCVTLSGFGNNVPTGLMMIGRQFYLDIDGRIHEVNIFLIQFLSQKLHGFAKTLEVYDFSLT